MPDPIRLYFERSAAGWDERMPPDLPQILGDFIAGFAEEISEAQSILEIGTGTGALIPFLRQIAPDASLLSIDLALNMVSQARERAGTWVLEADAHFLPLPSGAEGGFDLVICHNSFPHFTDKPAALLEIKRVLKKGGLLMILHHFSREHINAIHRGIGDPVGDDMILPAVEMAHLLAEAGYVDLRIEDSERCYYAIGQNL